MKCLVCGGYSFAIICKQCQSELKPSLGVRVVDEISVYSFFAYSHLEFLLHCKYQPVGSRVYHLLAKLALQTIHKELMGVFDRIGGGVYGVGIDDSCKKGYSHSGIILKEISKIGIKPIYGELIAQNQVSYAGKSLEFREKNPKGFQSKIYDKKVIVIDDVITTGTSIKEAKEVLQKQGNEVLCAIVLCDARG